MNSDLDRQIREMVIIRLLVLNQDSREVAHIRNVRLEGSLSHFRTSTVQTSVEMPRIQYMHYDYEQLAS